MLFNFGIQVKALIAATSTVYVVLLPRVTVSVAGDAEMEKEFTTKATVIGCAVKTRWSTQGVRPLREAVRSSR